MLDEQVRTVDKVAQTVEIEWIPGRLEVTLREGYDEPPEEWAEYNPTPRYKKDFLEALKPLYHDPTKSYWEKEKEKAQQERWARTYNLCVPEGLEDQIIDVLNNHPAVERVRRVEYQKTELHKE